MSYRSNRNVTYVKPEVPKFLREIKERIGYQAPPDVNTKRIYPLESGDDVDVGRPDEVPTVVSLKPGDLTAEEANKARLRKEQEDDRKKIEKGEIKFKKPESRVGIHTSSEIKRKGTDLVGRDHKRLRREASEEENKSSINSRLLSFEEIDDD